MKAFRFLHAADLHLDTPFSGMSGVPDRLRRLLRESTFAAFDRLIRLAIEEAVDFIVISGDIYDASDSSLRAQLRLREGWDKLGEHGIPVYLIRGNHDPLSGRRLRLALPGHVYEFGPRAESVTAVRRHDGEPVAVLTGSSYPTPAVHDNLALQYRREPGSALYHIGLLHGNVDGQEGHDAYAPCSLRDLEASGYDYWALGHIHKRQILCESPWVVYPGNIQGRSLKETGPKGCYLVEVAENGEAELSFHRLDQVLWQESRLAINGLTTEEAWKASVEEQLDELREAEPGRITVVRLTFTGRGPLHGVLQSGSEAAELLQELRRKESLKLETASLDTDTGAENLRLGEGIVWLAGFKLETGMELDRESLLAEDSFLGELFRLGEQTTAEPEVVEELVRAALAPLSDNRQLRRLLQELDSKAKQNLLRRAEELAAALLNEDTPLLREGRGAS
ncbi:DNA repair exonuclease [Paenibacillus sp. MBLB2552]|uniref:DNA repair exonuclease n=1 Tax=Paenibacillus mellifer TaxID=2937794 RepID=A0A9X1XZV8_9BACL|nr:DNA repair exonuclease [Paenibacillus mellifer]MCK8488775.1 DNA repair exonuclease [Paenibacillus mellifer]